MGEHASRVLPWVAGFALAAGLVHARPTLAPVVLMLPAVVAGWLVSTRSPATGLTVFLVTLLLVPAQLVLAPLGGLGTLSVVVALGLGAWWVAGRLPWPSHFDRGQQPMRTAAAVVLCSSLASYAAGMLRPISGFEVAEADRAMIFLVSVAAVVVVVADGLATRRQLDRLLGLATALVAAVAAVGLVQFTTGFDPTAVIELPGLRRTGGLVGIRERAGLPRVAGTATHPIEFGLVLAATLPLALHQARFSATRRVRVAAAVATASIAAAVPLALARSALLATLLGLAVVAVGSRGRARVRLLLGVSAVVAVVLALLPAVAGAQYDLFVEAPQDPSVVNRFADLGPVMALIAENPLLGRGLGTFSPEMFFVVDNQYLVTLIESGVLGLAGLLTPFVMALLAAVGARRRLRDEAGRDLALALAAAVVVALVGMGSLGFASFRMIGGLAFLHLGAVGALWRFATPRTPPPVGAALAAPTRHTAPREGTARLPTLRLPATAHPDVLRTMIVDNVTAVLPGATVVLWLWDDCKLRAVTTTGRHPPVSATRDDGDRLLRLGMKSSRPRAVPRRLHRVAGGRAALLLALRAGRRTAGVLTVGHTLPEPDGGATLAVYADQAATALLLNDSLSGAGGVR